MAADRGHSSHASREHVCDLGARPAIPSRRGDRYEKAERSFLGVHSLAAAMDRIGR